MLDTQHSKRARHCAGIDSILLPSGLRRRSDAMERVPGPWCGDDRASYCGGGLAAVSGFWQVVASRLSRSFCLGERRHGPGILRKLLDAKEETPMTRSYRSTSTDTRRPNGWKRGRGKPPSDDRPEHGKEYILDGPDAASEHAPRTAIRF